MANVLEVIISGDSKKLDRALNIAEKRLQKVGQKMQTIGKNMSLYVTAPLALAGGAMIKFASDYNESLNKVDVAFKNSSNSVKAFAKTSLESFGIAEGTALDMASLFGDMATSMGINTSEASKLSTSLVGLAGDLSSFKNMNIEEVTTALNGVFTGETESLKRLGVVMTEVNLEQFALTQNIEKSYKKMTQAEKVMLRYEYVMSKTANAHGDFERTGGGAANQMRMFTEGLKQLGAEFGQVVLPLFTKIVKVANDFLKSLSGLSSGVKGFVVGLGVLAGAMGPIIYLIGAMKNNWIDGIQLMRDAYKGFVKLLSNNPYILIGGAILGVVYAIYEWNDALDENAQKRKTLEEINDNARQNVVDEISKIERLVSLIKDQNVSLEQKKKLIKGLNDVNPQYLGDLTLININTEEGTKILNNYKNMIYELAKAEEIRGKIIELTRKSVEKELITSDNYVGSIAKLSVMLQGNLTAEEKKQKLLKMGEGVKQKELEAIQKQIDLLKEMSPVGADIDSLLKDLNEGESNLANNTAEANKELKIALDLLEDVADTSLTIKSAIGKSMDEIGVLLKEYRDFWSGIIAPVKQLKSLDFGGQFAKAMSFFQPEGAKKVNQPSIDSQFFKAYATGGQVSTNIKTPASLMNEQLNKDNAETKRLMGEQAKVFNESMALMSPIAQGIENLFSNLSRSIVESLNTANTGFGAFLSSMASYLLDLGGMILKEIMMIKAQAIALAILNGLKEGSMKGVVGMVAMGGLIAGAIGTINHHFQKSVPKFADGGIVSGPTMAMVGEYSGAKRNPEIIAPLDRLQSMMGGANGNVNVTGEFVVRGQDLVLALQRADQFKNRIS